jgi:Kef-type K+ transport system membrane component KefB
MHDVTFSLAILLAVGFAMAKAGQFLRLPSVTGYICAGFLLGPSGLGLLSHELLDEGLAHFTQIAFMLIALGIGEHLEIRRLKKTIHTQLVISAAEILITVLTVGTGIYLLAGLPFFGLPLQSRTDLLIIALLLGSVAATTAPDTTLHVIRETMAVGPVARTLLQSVAINNAMAIMLFGFALATARHLTGGEGSFSEVMMRSAGVIFFSLALGVGTGYIIDKLFQRLKDRGEMLTIGLALLLLSGEAARYFTLFPLLVGMSVGFTIVNRDRRDVRLFRVLNSFEPPIYVLFFILAGAHLEFSSLTVAGWLGLLYFLLRVAGKIVGARLGASLAKMPREVKAHLGPTLIPQAGVAIGLVFLLRSLPQLERYAAILLPVVLAGAFLAEMIGPACAKIALEKAGETAGGALPADNGRSGNGVDLFDIQFMPWTWGKLTLPRAWKKPSYSVCHRWKPWPASPGWRLFLPITIGPPLWRYASPSWRPVPTRRRSWPTAPSFFMPPPWRRKPWAIRCRPPTSSPEPWLPASWRAPIPMTPGSCCSATPCGTPNSNSNGSWKRW